MRLVAAVGVQHLPGVEAFAPSHAWLFGGSVGRAYVDNSAALHRHVLRARPERAVHWVIDRDSPDVRKARREGPVMFRDSIGTVVTALSADVHVISHGVHDVPGTASRLARHALRVRLGHGLTALKRTKPRVFQTNASANAIFDLVPVASEFEKANKRAWDIPDQALVVTGLPRFDELLRKASRPRAPGPRSIVYMPTWRDWVPMEPSAGQPNPFVRTVVDFLAAPALIDVLERHDALLKVCLHPILRRHATSLRRTAAKRIVIVDDDVDVQDVLAASDALLTDYSSVTWDALYVDKPVFFFSFDLDRYESERGAYFDLRRDLPGPAASTGAACVDMLDDALAHGLPLGDAARRWQERAFAFRDDRNCARVLARIEERLEQGR